MITVPKETLAGEKVSSTRIRAALQNGEMAEANRLLGYPYEFEGTVVHGDARDANLAFRQRILKSKVQCACQKKVSMLPSLK